MFYSYPRLIDNFSCSYLLYLDGIKDDIMSYCEKDENIGKLIEILYNNYEYDKGTFERYEYEALKRIICATESDEEYTMLHEDDYHWSHNYKYVLESILSFIHRYLHNSNVFLDFNVFGFSLKLKYRTNGTVDTIIDIQMFSCEQEMLDNGYTNKAEDILNYVKEYANIMVECGKK